MAWALHEDDAVPVHAHASDRSAPVNCDGATARYPQRSLLALPLLVAAARQGSGAPTEGGQSISTARAALGRAHEATCINATFCDVL